MENNPQPKKYVPPRAVDLSISSVNGLTGILADDCITGPTAAKNCNSGPSALNDCNSGGLPVGACTIGSAQA